MSTMKSVGGGSSVQEPSPLPRVSSSPDPAAGNVDDSLQSLQKLMQQIEGAANTKAIPAHQSW